MPQLHSFDKIVLSSGSYAACYIIGNSAGRHYWVSNLAMKMQSQ
jgi:hypothetical protein